MKSRYVSLRKNPAGSPENEKKISYPGKGTRFGKHLFITYVKIEYTLCVSGIIDDFRHRTIAQHVVKKFNCEAKWFE